MASQRPTDETAPSLESTRTGLSPEALKQAVLDNLACLQARIPEIATLHDWYMALAYSVRDRMLASLRFCVNLNERGG